MGYSPHSADILWEDKNPCEQNPSVWRKMGGERMPEGGKQPEMAGNAVDGKRGRGLKCHSG